VNKSDFKHIMGLSLKTSQYIFETFGKKQSTFYSSLRVYQYFRIHFDDDHPILRQLYPESAQ